MVEVTNENKKLWFQKTQCGYINKTVEYEPGLKSLQTKQSSQTIESWRHWTAMDNRRISSVSAADSEIDSWDVWFRRRREGEKSSKMLRIVEFTKTKYRMFESEMLASNWFLLSKCLDEERCERENRLFCKKKLDVLTLKRMMLQTQNVHLMSEDWFMDKHF